MQAVILAGGKGQRLRPYTVSFPKPLMPVGDTPILEIIVRQLKHAGAAELIMAVGHLKELLMTYFEGGKKWNLPIRYSFEDKIMGTAGPLTLINDLDQNFMVLNGDVLTTIDYSDFWKFHIEKKSLCTIATYKKSVKIDLGVIQLNDDNTVSDYLEKPSLDYDVSMGIYAFNREVLKSIPLNQYFDFPDLVKKLLKEGEKVHTYPFSGIWLDIGRHEDYESATEIYEKNKKLFLHK